LRPIPSHLERELGWAGERTSACEAERVELNTLILAASRSGRREPRHRIGVDPLRPPAQNSEEPDRTFNGRSAAAAAVASAALKTNRRKRDTGQKE